MNYWLNRRMRELGEAEAEDEEVDGPVVMLGGMYFVLLIMVVVIAWYLW